MIQTFFKIAFRNIFRNKVYAALNIVGLAMGIAAFLLLLQYISLEKSVNGFHSNLTNMYRLLNEDKTGKTWPEVEPGWAISSVFLVSLYYPVMQHHWQNPIPFFCQKVRVKSISEMPAR